MAERHIALVVFIFVLVVLTVVGDAWSRGAF